MGGFASHAGVRSTRIFRFPRRHGRLVRQLGFDRVQDSPPIVDTDSRQIVLHIPGESKLIHAYIITYMPSAQSTPDERQRAGTLARPASGAKPVSVVRLRWSVRCGLDAVPRRQRERSARSLVAETEGAVRHVPPELVDDAAAVAARRPSALVVQPELHALGCISAIGARPPATSSRVARFTSMCDRDHISLKGAMSNLTIHDLDDRVIERLRAQAKVNQRSLEDEIRYVLTQQVGRRVRVAAFRERTRQIARMTTGTPQTDSVGLLREDRSR